MDYMQISLTKSLCNPFVAFAKNGLYKHLLMKKTNRNFSVPSELDEAYKGVLQEVGPKRQWAMATLGVLLVLELPKEERLRRLREIFGYDETNQIKELIENAKARAQTAEAASQTSARSPKSSSRLK